MFKTVFKTVFKNLRPIEGFFVETPERLIFDVKGLLHPPDRTVAYLRYYPCAKGARARNRVKYAKVYDLNERTAWLAAHYPQYLWYCDQWQMQVQAIPNTMVTPHDPRKKLQELQKTPEEELTASAKGARDLAQLLQSKVSDPSDVGVTGSILVGLENTESDYDLVVYGQANCRAIFAAMENLFASEPDLTRYIATDMPARYKARASGSGISLEIFSFHDLRKTHQGRFRNMDFFLRYVQYPEEAGVNFTTTRFAKMGAVSVTGVVEDANLALFTPCSYRVIVSSVEGTPTVNKQNITEIVSFRGRFCEQLLAGENFRGQGILERVETPDGSHYRLLLGNEPTDYLIKV